MSSWGESCGGPRLDEGDEPKATSSRDVAEEEATERRLVNVYPVLVVAVDELDSRGVWRAKEPRG